MLGDVLLAMLAQSGKRSDRADALGPGCRAEKGLLGCVHHRRAADDRRHREDVGDRLGKHRNVGVDIISEMRSAGIDAEARGHLVESSGLSGEVGYDEDRGFGARESWDGWFARAG